MISSFLFFGKYDGLPEEGKNGYLLKFVKRDLILYIFWFIIFLPFTIIYRNYLLDVPISFCLWVRQLDLQDYDVVTVDKDGNMSGKWIPFSDYYNPAPVLKPAIEKKPVTEYDPGKIYLNHADCVLTIPVEILEQAGRPLYFIVLWNHERNHLSIQFMDELNEDGFDISPRIYAEEWKGIHVVGDEFGRMLCNEMGIRRRLDLMEVTPVYNEKGRMLILDLEKAMPSNADLKYSCYLFPQIQYEEMRDEIDE